jgi:uncharacterized protein
MMRLKIRALLFGLPTLSLILAVGRTAALSQSFPCAAARTADEAIICQNGNLAKLDLKMAQLYDRLSARSSSLQKQALANDQKTWLLSRRGCGMDSFCIQRSYEQRIEKLSASQTEASKPSKILFGPHAGDATIISLTGADTDNAVALFRRELDDLIEDCARNLGFKEDGDVDARKVSDCAKENIRQENGRVYKRRALCSKSTIYTEFGNYSMVNTEKESESVVDGRPYRPIRTDWKNHRNEEIVGNCSGCNTPQMLDTFKVLCPLSYSAYFSGYDPY